MSKIIFCAALVILSACAGSVPETLSQYPPYQPQILTSGQPVLGGQP